MSICKKKKVGKLKDGGKYFDKNFLSGGIASYRKRKSPVTRGEKKFFKRENMFLNKFARNCCPIATSSGKKSKELLFTAVSSGQVDQGLLVTIATGKEVVAIFHLQHRHPIIFLRGTKTIACILDTTGK
ncbi:hypothetical protein NPIL_439241 [Nephila pilipes]|uniref:Uncharacterized protein n=1 Tax=Nephila pilipes TaxID=299642 RepID=A0A8X6N4X9_NEPPI|nr:hypothetical protein NPIL_439241 [Nephila pilipes]